MISVGIVCDSILSLSSQHPELGKMKVSMVLSLIGYLVVPSDTAVLGRCVVAKKLHDGGLSDFEGYSLENCEWPLSTLLLTSLTTSSFLGFPSAPLSHALSVPSQGCAWLILRASSTLWLSMKTHAVTSLDMASFRSATMTGVTTAGTAATCLALVGPSLLPCWGLWRVEGSRIELRGLLSP